MPILSGGAIHVVEVQSAKAKRLISNYWGVAVQHFLNTGETEKLEPYARLRIRGIPFDTDPDVIEDWWLGTDFDFQEYYQP